MESAGHEVGKIEKRLRKLGRQLDELSAKADVAGAEVQVDFRKQIDHIKEKHTEVHTKLSAYRNAGGQKWDNFKAGVEVAWLDLEKAFKELKS
jgi:uncharacterized coiled-coil DUF342 family protein